MRKSWIVLGLLAGCTGAPRLPHTAQGDTVLEVRGALKKGPYALGRGDLGRLPRRTLRGLDPATGRTASWEGVSVAAIVSERVDLATGADTVIVRTADRAAIPIPLTLIRQWRPVLADRADGEPLPSAVLAWPTLEQRGLETDPRADGWWARDVVAFEIVEWERAFAAALSTPDGATDVARRGSAAYADRCLRCHRMRGAGGERGPDLTTVAARLGPGPFAALLERHPRRTTSVGEPLGPQGPDELWSFLRAVAAAPGGARAELTADRGAAEPNAP
ncbi:MAG TPA: c-type cytochrome [Anaeromyxobacter sp.]|nr:c-type cytochrome [Anaeromyxobacter sp.]